MNEYTDFGARNRLLSKRFLSRQVIKLADSTTES